MSAVARNRPAGGARSPAAQERQPVRGTLSTPRWLRTEVLAGPVVAVMVLVPRAALDRRCLRPGGLPARAR